MKPYLLILLATAGQAFSNRAELKVAADKVLRGLWKGGDIAPWDQRKPRDASYFPPSASQRRPNLLWITLDDWRADAGVYAPDASVRETLPCKYKSPALPDART